MTMPEQGPSHGEEFSQEVIEGFNSFADRIRGDVYLREAWVYFSPLREAENFAVMMQSFVIGRQMTSQSAAQVDDPLSLRLADDFRGAVTMNNIRLATRQRISERYSDSFASMYDQVQQGFDSLLGGVSGEAEVDPMVRKQQELSALRLIQARIRSPRELQ